jgi:RHS repeat-associated protein
MPIEKNNKSENRKEAVKSSVVSAPSISLPKGGGAIRGIGEKFAANPVTGTGSFNVPIAVTPGRSGYSPQLSLSYDSGSGNGPFGFGWDLSLPEITRKTDKGLPKYEDANESDIFILSGAEDLVPVLEYDDNSEEWNPESFPCTLENVDYTVQQYRPRTEGLFARIEKWTNKNNGDIHWRSISNDNITTIYGKDTQSRIVDPNDPLRIFSWLICESFDERGNAIIYEYVPEDSAGIDLSQVQEKNRTEESRQANRYLKRIKYGNLTPNRDENWKATDPTQLSEWMFEVVFDYDEGHYQELPANLGEHRYIQAVKNKTKDWSVRQDPFSTYRPGFEVRTYRLCQRVLMFHHFPGELGQDDYLVRSTEFTYNQSFIASFIVSVTQSGYVLNEEDGTYLKKSLPPLEFEYSRAEIQEQVWDVDAQSLENLPSGLDGSTYQWVDLNGEGLSGILTEQADAWFYKANRGNGQFAPLQPLAVMPSVANIVGGQQQLLDLGGDGQLDLVQFRQPLPGFYERTHDEQWKAFTPFESCPLIDWNDPNLKFIDLTGDGHADILMSEDHVFTWYLSLAEQGFAPSQQVQKIFDEEKGPKIIFADGTQSVYLADLSGDGLTDIVRIHNGEVCYWPNLGYGRFGAKITMAHSPWFDFPDQFNQCRLHLADIDGSGTTDMIYFGHEQVSLYFNQSGNSWSDVQYLTQFPHTDNLTSVTVVDLLGNGTACIVWSSPLPGDREQPMCYIDLMGGQKPHLLTMVKNNMGAETRVRYSASTQFYLQDRADGKPWVTRLPFPVHVVERVETYDRISKNRFVSRHSYHHGYFDGVEREFRGFGMVEQWDTEEIGTILANENYSNDQNLDEASFVPPVFTRTWFHTGAYIKGKKISRQYETEYFREPGLSDVQAEAMLLPDTLLPVNIMLPDNSTQPCDLTPGEMREACRVLRGSILRQEVYAQDGSEKSEFPYTVSENNYKINWFQPKKNNQHAVFFVLPGETINYHYERSPHDPRTSHELTLEADAFGNALKSAAIGYGRRQPDLALDSRYQEKQTQMLMTFTENKFTNIIDQEDAFHTPLPCETLTYELTGLELNGKVRFSCEDILEAAASYAEINYQETPDGSNQKRLIQHDRILYLKDDLSNALPLGEVETMTLPYESYELAFTPGLLNNIFIDTGKISATDLYNVLANKGAYIDLDKDGHWWIPYGQVFYSPHAVHTTIQELTFAREHFFQPHRFCDPFGNTTTVNYDSRHLLVSQTIDPLDNITTVENDYRVMQPKLVIDLNDNHSEVKFDALGMVVGTAVMGKVGKKEGDSLEDFEPNLDDNSIMNHIRNPLHNPHDILNKATTRIIYDLHRYMRSRGSDNLLPNMVYTLARETHDADLEDQQTKIQYSFLYSDGFGREIQTKVQAEPGDAPLRENNCADPDRPGTLIMENYSPKIGHVHHRWVGTGQTIYNNKGKTVKKYEPFFSSTHLFEEEPEVAETGITPIIFYDPLERMVATLHPNHTYGKVVFDPWHQETWDVNDTINPLVKFDPRQFDPGIPIYPDHAFNPINDPDVGHFFIRLPTKEYLPTWYDLRMDDIKAAEKWPDVSNRNVEKNAAQKASRHVSTPAIAYLDTMGRSFLTIADNGLDENGIEQKYRTYVELDIEGKHREIIDARENKAIQYDYDMLSRSIFQNSMDAGERWVLDNVIGNPVKRWDARNHEFTYSYDELQRPILSQVKGNDGDTPLDNVFEKILYGDWKAMTANDRNQGKENNLIGQPKEHYDTVGKMELQNYDFKGNLTISRRWLTKDYKNIVDWSGTTPDDLLEKDESFINETSYDALNRVIRSKTPDKSISKPAYNEANLLEGVKVTQGDTTDIFVKDIAYNEKGQRTGINYGNDVTTTYEYDKETFRLTHLQTKHPDNGLLQDFYYTYDPAGKITEIRDETQQDIFFSNQVVSSNVKYEYDALYRLIKAEGREHPGQVENCPNGQEHRNDLKPHYDFNDCTRKNFTNPNNDQAMRNYARNYEYDAVGNILAMIHRANNNGNWTRRYQYKLDNNQLMSTGLPGDPQDLSIPVYSENYQYSARYQYDNHGNIIGMPHLQVMKWNFNDELQAAAKQRRTDGGTPETTYYVYDTGGQRVRKVTENSAAPNATPSRKCERIYVGGIEIYREYQGEFLNKERKMLHVMDDTRRIAMVESLTGSSEKLTRYQHSNHLGTACLETDGSANARVITYEEYHPYGTTSYQAVNKSIKAAVKRYRYTGKEREEETGLYYNTSRYYVPWLARWINTDPQGINGGLNLYGYAYNNPVSFSDPSGRQPPLTYSQGFVNQNNLPVIPFAPGNLPGTPTPTRRLNLNLNFSNYTLPTPSTQNRFLLNVKGRTTFIGRFVKQLQTDSQLKSDELNRQLEYSPPSGGADPRREDLAAFLAKSLSPGEKATNQEKEDDPNTKALTKGVGKALKAVGTSGKKFLKKEGLWDKIISLPRKHLPAVLMVGTVFATAAFAQALTGRWDLVEAGANLLSSAEPTGTVPALPGSWVLSSNAVKKAGDYFSLTYLVLGPIYGLGRATQFLTAKDRLKFGIMKPFTYGGEEAQTGINLRGGVWYEAPAPYQMNLLGIKSLSVGASGGLHFDPSGTPGARLEIKGLIFLKINLKE